MDALSKPVRLILSVLALALGLGLALGLPNPFADLSLGERPSKLILFFRVAGGVLALAALGRLVGEARKRG